ncbi:TMhelix containing protein [Vibrio phage 1.081.O._10N.286.52.C2]|nr:TMhelix containing protein [Vibrio phage 1.081.O._10N.286.52.C2]
MDLGLLIIAASVLSAIWIVVRGVQKRPNKFNPSTYRVEDQGHAYHGTKPRVEPTID